MLDDTEAAELRPVRLTSPSQPRPAHRSVRGLIGAYGTTQLRSTIARVHDELRARGVLEPGLPPAPDPPLREDMLAACRLVERVAAAAERELGAVNDPGQRVSEAVALLGSGPQRAGVRLAVARRASADQARHGRVGTADAASATTTALRWRSSPRWPPVTHAVGVRDALDALLSEYGRRYAALKRERSGLDFSDLELMARELLRKRDEVGSRYRERFLRVMVDEMQDTNGVQLELIDLVAGPICSWSVTPSSRSTASATQTWNYSGSGAPSSNGAAVALRCRPTSARTRRSSGAQRRLRRCTRRKLPASCFPAVSRRAPATDPLVELMVVDKDAIAASFQPETRFSSSPRHRGGWLRRGCWRHVCGS